MSKLNKAQKQAMIDFCVANAGEIKYVPQFNDEGKCTVKTYMLMQIAQRKNSISKTCSICYAPTSRDSGLCYMHEMDDDSMPADGP